MHLAAVSSITMLATHDVPDDPWSWLETYSMWWALMALFAVAAFLIALVVVVPAGMVPALLLVRAIVRWHRNTAGEDRPSSGLDDDRVAGCDGAGLEDPGVGP